jgi:hypothetical protein
MPIEPAQNETIAHETNDVSSLYLIGHFLIFVGIQRQWIGKSPGDTVQIVHLTSTPLKIECATCEKLVLILLINS